MLDIALVYTTGKLNDRTASLSAYEMRGYQLFLVRHHPDLDWTEISSIIDLNGIHLIYQQSLNTKQ